LALNYGGYKESVIDGVTGYFFDEQTEESIIDSVNRFEQDPLTDFAQIRKNTIRFSAERFRAEVKLFVDEKKIAPKHNDE
jgi:glycosyltransferase involved in cell wall biosynthesis